MGRTKKRASTTRHILPQIDFSKDFSESKCIPSSSITPTLEKQADASVVIEEGSSMFNNEDNNGPFKLVLPFDLKGHSLSDDEMNHNQSKVIEKKGDNNIIIIKKPVSLLITIYCNHFTLLILIIISILGFESTINDMQIVQNQMLTIIQDIQKTLMKCIWTGNLLVALAVILKTI